MSKAELGEDREPTMYDKMVAKGIDMSWYDKSRKKNKSAKGPAPLSDEACSLLSIYYLDKGGKLFTTKSDGASFMMVRIIKSKPKEPRYICAACGGQFNNYKEATEHYERS